MSAVVTTALIPRNKIDQALIKDHLISNEHRNARTLGADNHWATPCGDLMHNL